MARNEVEMTEEEHMLGKAIMGIVAFILVLLIVGFALLRDFADIENKDIPINYLDDVVNESTKKIA